MASEQEGNMEMDPKLIEDMQEKTQAVYKAFEQARDAMRSAAFAIEELQATLLPSQQQETSEPARPHKSTEKSKQRHAPYSTSHTHPTIANIVTSPSDPASAPLSSGSTALFKKRAPRSPGRPAPPGYVSSRREPPSFTPEQAQLLDEFIKYFNLRVESTNIPQWKIGAEISQLAGNTIKMDQSTVSRMARRLGVPKSQTGVEAVKRWIAAEKAKIAAQDQEGKKP